MLLYYPDTGPQAMSPVAVGLPKKLGQGLIEIGNEIRRLLLELDIALIIEGVHARAYGGWTGSMSCEDTGL